ncbi:MAG: [LysW]-aminoadipate kinase [Anaerolineae bacterium]|nr:[LysW]-aminoadipate kinase [Anaerolineae bacterium]
MSNLQVLKIGGGAGIDPAQTLANVAARVRQGERWIVVHGASDAANTLGERMGVPPQMIATPGGHSSRYTNPETLEIYCAAAGLVNTRVTAVLGYFGMQAAGLSGVSVLRAGRKTAIRGLVNGRQVIIRDDYSGALEPLSDGAIRTLQALLQAGVIPVISPVALGFDGERLNVDGDLVAALIAGGLRADTLVILSNVPGLLREVGQPDSLITNFSANELDHYANFAQGRMKKKLIAAKRALEASVNRIILADARVEAPLDAAFAGNGTHIVSSECQVLSAE